MKAAVRAAINTAIERKQVKRAKRAARLSEILKPDLAQVAWETSRRAYLLRLGRRDRAEAEGLL